VVCNSLERPQHRGECLQSLHQPDERHYSRNSTNTVGAGALADVADEARALVTSEELASYDWHGLTLTVDQSDALAQLEAQLATVTAERDARFTAEQIHALSADYTMGLNETDKVEIKIFFIESADLQTFTPFTVDPDSVSVVDGKICLEFASEDRGFFFRFRVE